MNLIKSIACKFIFSKSYHLNKLQKTGDLKHRFSEFLFVSNAGQGIPVETHPILQLASQKVHYRGSRPHPVALP